MQRGIAILLGALLPSLVGAYNPTTGDYSRRDARDLRVLSWNMQQYWTDPDTQASGDRILVALKPDVILLQEIADSETALDVTTRLNRVLPPPAGGTWSAQMGNSDGYSRCAIASRFPLTLGRSNLTPPTEPRGVPAALVLLPDNLYATDLYLMSLHFKASGSSSDESRRQASADAMQAWIRDIKAPGGSITLPAGTPMVYGGDTNLRSTTAQSIRASTTMVTGDILDEASYGADIRPDWDSTDVRDVFPADPFNGDTDTHSSTSATIRFDRFYCTDSALTVPTSFVFNPRTMSGTARSGAGVQQFDGSNTTDHLPIVMDVRLPLPPVAGGMWMLY